MQLIIEKLLGFKNRNLTTKMYLSVWRLFNRFVMSLDIRPKLWEDRTILFIGYLVDKGMQSTTVKSYVSAIKRMLVDDGYPWEDGKILLTSLTKACRIINDQVMHRLPIRCGLLELILFKVRCRFASDQAYLCILYMILIAIGYCFLGKRHSGLKF